MTEPTKDESRLAHYIACRGHKAGTPRWWAAYDAAIAAIRETTERAAKEAGHWYQMVAGEEIADALRNNEHLKEPNT